jgi:alkaline phosphatase D
MKNLLCSLAVLGFTCGAVATARGAEPVTKKDAIKKKIGGQYKRVHQRALDLITSGTPAKAVEHLNAYLEKFSDDAETQFMLTVAYSQLGEKEKALAAMQKALDMDLPSNRFVAGPRDLLKPIADTEEFQKLIKRNDIVHGPMVGSVTDTSARVWVRTCRELRLRLIDASDVKIDKRPGGTPLPQNNVASLQDPTPENDFTAVLEVSKLEPSKDYLFLLAVVDEEDGWSVLDSAVSFRTAAKPGSPTTFKLAFGGGAGYVPPNERVWDTIRETKPALLLMLGDNTYSDNPTSPAMQKYCYYRRQSRPEWRKLTLGTPVYAIWDDHDFGTNDCLGGAAVDDPPWKPAVWKVFTQNWVNPSYGGGEQQPGVWFTFGRGDVDFFMLDCRAYRTSPKLENPTMLGPVQLAWLKEELSKSKGTFKVICSSVPWDYRTKGSSLDTWNGFRGERDDIFNHLADNKIEGVILMSADRHRSDAWKIDRDNGYSLYEFNSSRLTNQHVHGTMKEAIFSYNEKQSFGTVEFDTTVDDPTVVYKVVTIDGEVVHELAIKHSQLKH